MATKKDAVTFLDKDWRKISLDLLDVQTQLSTLEEQKKAILDHLRGLLTAFEVLGAKPSMGIPQELRFGLNASLGDAMEQILLEYGPLAKKILIKELRQGGRLTGKNARVILANAIKRDGKKRFDVFGGVVFLADNDHHKKVIDNRKRELARESAGSQRVKP